MLVIIPLFVTFPDRSFHTTNLPKSQSNRLVVFYGRVAILEAMEWLKKNQREAIGWAVIALFSYIYLFQINNWELLAKRDRAFDFLVVTTFFTLAWLKLNKKKNNE